MELGWNFQIYKAAIQESLLGRKLLYLLNLVLVLYMEFVRFPYDIDLHSFNDICPALLAVLFILSIEPKGKWSPSISPSFWM